MSPVRWQIQCEGESLTLLRGNRARLDVAAQTEMPDAVRARIAHQVRQDMWRLLRNLRGFSPIVQVRRVSDHLQVTAGGQISGCFSKDHVEGMIQTLLDCPKFRARWLDYARLPRSQK